MKTSRIILLLMEWVPLAWRLINRVIRNWVLHHEVDFKGIISVSSSILNRSSLGRWRSWGKQSNCLYPCTFYNPWTLSKRKSSSSPTPPHPPPTPLPRQPLWEEINHQEIFHGGVPWAGQNPVVLVANGKERDNAFGCRHGNLNFQCASVSLVFSIIKVPGWQFSNKNLASSS